MGVPVGTKVEVPVGDKVGSDVEIVVAGVGSLEMVLGSCVGALVGIPDDGASAAPVQSGKKPPIFASVKLSPTPETAATEPFLSFIFHRQNATSY